MSGLIKVSEFSNELDSVLGKRAYIGISSCYPFFSNVSVEECCEKYVARKKLALYAQWGNENCKQLTLFLADYLLHYNIMAFCGKSSSDAVAEAERVGDLLADKIQKFAKGNVHFLRWGDVYPSDEFQGVLEKVSNFAAQNKKFSGQCAELTLAGTRNRLKILKHQKNKGFDEALRVAEQYAVDDVALMLYLYTNNPVSVSKYEIPPVLKSACNGEYPELTRGRTIGHVQLVPEGEKVYASFYDNDFEVIGNGSAKA